MFTQSEESCQYVYKHKESDPSLDFIRASQRTQYPEDSEYEFILRVNKAFESASNKPPTSKK
ncbi:5761_t:CDS:1, partial [Ambispora leptoticha]